MQGAVPAQEHGKGAGSPDEVKAAGPSFPDLEAVVVALEAGKVANVVVWSGDPLDFSGAADKVFIRGKDVSLRTRETELFERYRKLPVEY